MRHKAMRWSGIVFQVLAFYLLGNQIYGAEKIDIVEVGSRKWVERKIETYPELAWLLSEDVEHTQEGTSSQQEGSWSRKLKGSHYPEFERTMATLVNLYLILDGSEEAFIRFVESQPKEEVLTRDNFNKLHTYALKVISDQQEGVKAVEVELILGDMGKTTKARELAKAFSVEEKDHDIFLSECLKKCPKIFPTFQKISKTMQADLIESGGLVHFGHVTHLEGGPEILNKLKGSGLVANNPKAFDLQVLTYMMDVSGARAHESNLGSKSFTNKTFLAINGMKDALHKLAERSPEEALTSYVGFRAGLLGLDPQKKEDRVLGRMGAMMRLFTPEEGQALTAAYHLLGKEQKKVVEQEFDPLRTRKERTPTYIPAVFVNFIDSAMKQGITKEEAIQACIKEGVVSIASFLQKYREGKANQPYRPQMTLNFNKSAGQVKNNINIFRNHDFSIDKDWNVTLIELTMS
jgi:hypothetical protein